MYKRIAVAVLALIGLAAIVWAAGERSSQGIQIPRAFDDACGDEGLATLNVRVTPSKFTYRTGNAARFLVEVTRSVKSDEHDEGHEIGPAEGVEVSTVLTIRNRYLGARGTTDDDGRVKLRVHVPADMPTGSADIMTLAERKAADVDCVPHESGHFDAEDFIRIRR